MIVFFTTLLFFGTAAVDGADGWISLERNKNIDYDLESSPLQIKTDSATGSGDNLRVYFYTADGSDAGIVFIEFNSTAKYRIYGCNKEPKPFQNNLPSEVNKTWKITKTTEPLRITVHCNGEKVLDFLMSDTTCNDKDWDFYWSKDVEKIIFRTEDSASDFYRATGKCDALNVENALVSHSGRVEEDTVVTVTCAKPKHYALFGEKGVTCQSEGEWSTPPTCRKCGINSFLLSEQF